MARDPTMAEWVVNKAIGRSSQYAVQPPHNRETLSGNKTLAASDAPFQNLDPDGSARTVTLPAEAEGLWFIIGNRAGAANAITVNDDSGTTLCTVNQDDTAIIVCDGTGWMASAAAGGVT